MKITDIVENIISKVNATTTHKNTTGNPHGTVFSDIGSKPTTVGGYGLTDVYTKTEVNNSLTLKVNNSEKGVANGVATLDANGKVVLTQIPDSVLGQLEYMGVHNFTTMPTAIQKGQYWIASVSGNGYIVGDWAVWNGSAFDKVDNTDAVATVAGRTGNVVLTNSDVGLANVDNTADSAKPVSTAQQTALNLKANLASPTFTGTVTAPTFSGALSGNAGTATTLSTTRANYNGITNSVVVGELMWKAYGNNHTIFDASQSTTPTGVAKNNTNPDIPWSPMFPTLMGYNGNNTYGVRVDSSRYADSATTAYDSNKLIGKNWYWSGQGGQPTWLWGGNDGVNMYVYNPSNFNVNYANSAGSTSSVTYSAAAYGAAQLPCGEIGTYAFLAIPTNSSSISPDTNYAGSSLQYAGVNTSSNPANNATSGGIGGTPTGTWRAMGYCGAKSDRYAATLFLRIA